MKSGNNCIYFAFCYFSRNVIDLLQDQLMSLCSKLHLYFIIKVQMFLVSILIHLRRENNIGTCQVCLQYRNEKTN